ncbi:TonB-dependent receptor [Emcibacter nanhaiensis]|uniref:TonB-dependent receptor n=1 Tax=Emcibacter nanhaiensis TaxID=1505037 RepID=A0A501PJ40_9PROT|nr:TonB-dependent receptor [Emcibacter nanhaiensis]TPD60245.1 TonB-dependent receptor [Emcibacter nanhaiensis]
MTSSRLIRLLGTTSLLGSLAVTGSVQGASAAEEIMILEEVVVTARMRSESLQEVPLSETAFSAQAIEDARIDTAGDFLALTPNVSLAEAQSAGTSFLTIRGVSQVRNGESPVAVVVDDVLQINSRQLTQPMFDIESIEVLRGPQGALYGRNATGGAILITTKKPGNEFEGSVRASYGTGEDYILQGSVSGPIVKDKLLFRVAGRYQNKDGYFTNKYLNEKVDYLEDVAVRAMLNWNISDNVTLDLRGSILRTDGGANNFQYQAVVYDGDSCFSSNPFGGTNVGADVVSRDFCGTNIGENERDVDEFSAKLTVETDAATFTNIFSYNRVTEYVAADQFPYTAAVDVFGIFDGTQTQYVDVDAWSNEFRIASPSDQALTWMVGAYYLKTDRFISTTTGDDNEMGFERIERLPAFDSTINPTLSFLADDNDNEAWALFGNAAYNVTDKLEVAVAVRYDEDHRKQTVSEYNTSGTQGAVNEQTYSKFQPKVTAKYSFTDDVSAYASWGIGFRSGQFNQNGVGAVAADAGTNGVSDVVKQEENETFEIGFKSELLDNRLRLNGAVFHTKLDNPLYFVFIGSVGAQVLVNIDEVELQGFELEAAATLGEGLDIVAGFGYTDSEIKSYAVDPAQEGNNAPYIPETTFNLGVQYRTAITQDYELLARADYERRGAQYWDAENSTARSAINLVNARIGIENVDQGWSITGSVNNLTDEKYNSEWVSGGFSHPAAPRTWHIDLRYNF